MRSCHIIELLVNTRTSINYWERLAILYLCDIFSAVQWHLLVSAASICIFLMRRSSVKANRYYYLLQKYIMVFERLPVSLGLVKFTAHDD